MITNQPMFMHFVFTIRFENDVPLLKRGYRKMNQRLDGQQPLLIQQQIHERSKAILGKNLEQNGEPGQPDYVPHHIIPLYGQAKDAHHIKALFDQFFPPHLYQHLPLNQWPINQAMNGVWMRRNRLHLLQSKEMPLSFTHDADYYQALYERLKNKTSKEDFLAELLRIKEDLSQHRFWDQHPSKLAEIEDFRQQKIAEQRTLATLDAEMEAFLPKELKDELDQWPSSLQEAAIKKVADEFSDILQRYEKAQESRDAASFDAFLAQELPPANTLASSLPADLSPWREILAQQGFLGYQQPIHSTDPKPANSKPQDRQRTQFLHTLQQESKRKPFPVNSFSTKYKSERSK